MAVPKASQQLNFDVVFSHFASNSATGAAMNCAAAGIRVIVIGGSSIPCSASAWAGMTRATAEQFPAQQMHRLCMGTSDLH